MRPSRLLFRFLASLAAAAPPAAGQGIATHPPIRRACVPDIEALVPPLGPFALLGENDVLGVSAEWMVYTRQVAGPSGVLSRVQAHHVPTSQTLFLGIDSEGGAPPAAWSPLGDFIFLTEHGPAPRLHTYDLGTHTLTDTGLTTRYWMGQPDGGNTFLFAVRETAVDENGDGDLDDYIAYGGNLSDGTFVSSGRATSANHPSQVWIDGVRGAWLEAEEPGRDLNGDGDFDDQVYYVHDFALGVGLSLGLAHGQPVSGHEPAFDEGRFVFFVSEAAQSTDLLGDGDLDDVVLHVLDLTVGTLSSLGVNGSAPTVDGRDLVYHDLDTNTVHVFDLVSGLSTDLGVPLAGLDGPWVEERTVLFTGRESTVDWNGDGDLLDDVLWIYELDTGLLVHSGGAVDALFAEHADTDGRFVVYARDEEAQGATDLNGDGDAFDRVGTLWEPRTGLVRNLGIGQNGPASVHGAFMAFTACEGCQGLGQDLNGDGFVGNVVVLRPTVGVGAVRFAPVALRSQLTAVPGLGWAAEVLDPSSGPPHLKVLLLEACPY